MSKAEQALLENHLAFLASHRGSIRRGEDTISLESERSEFTYALLGKTVPKNVPMVQLLPWSEVATSQLEQAGFSFAIGFSYMTLGEHRPKWHLQGDLKVESVSTQQQMDLFSEVQSRGFNETPESFAHWHPWLKAANDKNRQNEKQMFYVGYLDDEPVGTALTVYTGDIAGIYAVATLPQHRKKGISATVMQRAIEDAKKRGAKTITLQVKQDSYVEEFYRRLGFQRNFITGFYRRNS